MQDLELLHHYSTHTASTLHGDSSMTTLLRVMVPKLGFEYEFVMRGVLALSALHLAHFRPDKSDLYLALAVHHQDIGLRAATSLLTSLTEENCSAVYIFSAYTLYHALASPKKPGDLLITGENGVADWLFLLKGCSYIMSSSYDSLLAGPFGPMFKAGSRRNEIREAHAASLPPLELPVDELRALIHTTVHDQAHLKEYDAAIAELRKSLVMSYYQGAKYEGGELFIWLFRATQGFLKLLRSQTPESLTILAYFCVLLSRCEYHWWLEGWSVHLISKIYELLSPEYRLWIRWPIEEIGWIPDH